MSDQQPTPESPRPDDPGAAPPPPGGPVPAAGAPVPAPGPSVPPAGAPVPSPASPAAEPAPPVWPAHAQGSPPAPPPGQPYPPAPAYPGYPAPGYPPAGYPYPPAQTTSTNAVVGLILSILSWVLCPIIPAIVALVLAKKSGEEIAASQGRVGGEGLNTATKIISWINIGLYGALVLIGGAFVLIAIVLGAASSTTS